MKREDLTKLDVVDAAPTMRRFAFDLTCPGVYPQSVRKIVQHPVRKNFKFERPVNRPVRESN